MGAVFYFSRVKFRGSQSNVFVRNLPCPVDDHLFQRTDNPVILKKAHALRENFGIDHSGRGTDKTEVEKKAVCRYPEQINSITSR